MLHERINIQNFKLREIPKDIHFIWMGPNLPYEYEVNVRSFIANGRQHRFTVHLWVDKFINAASFVNDPNVQIHLIDELYPRMNEWNMVFPGLQLGMRWQEIIALECGGFYNYPAGSDLLRIELLRQRGGYYVDTDTICNKELSPLKPKWGFMTCGIWYTTPSGGYFRHDIGNAVMVSTPDHYILYYAIIKAISRYYKARNNSLFQKIEQLVSNESSSARQHQGWKIGLQTRESDEPEAEVKTVDYRINRLDLKRLPSNWYIPFGGKQLATRCYQYTIKFTGPGLIEEAIRKFMGLICEAKLAAGIPETLQKFLICGKELKEPFKRFQEPIYVDEAQTELMDDQTDKYSYYVLTDFGDSIVVGKAKWSRTKFPRRGFTV